MFTDHIHPHHPEHSEEAHAHSDVSLNSVSDELNAFNKEDKQCTFEQNKNRILEAKKRAQRIKDILRAHIASMNVGNMGRYSTAKRYLEEAMESCDQCMNAGLSEHDNLDHTHLSIKHFGDVHSKVQNAIGILHQEHSINNGRHTALPQLYNQPPHHDLHHHTHESHHGGSGGDIGR